MQVVVDGRKSKAICGKVMKGCCNHQEGYLGCILRVPMFYIFCFGPQLVDKHSFQVHEL